MCALLNALSTFEYKLDETKYEKHDTDLLTCFESFDGINIFLPWYLMDIDYKTEGGYHIDQNIANKPSLHNSHFLIRRHSSKTQFYGRILLSTYLGMSGNNYMLIPWNLFFLHMNHCLHGYCNWETMFL